MAERQRLRSVCSPGATTTESSQTGLVCSGCSTASNDEPLNGGMCLSLVRAQQQGVRNPSLGECSEILQGRPQTHLVIVRPYPFGYVLAMDGDFSASRNIGQGPADRHRACELRVFRLEFDQLHDPLVRDQLQEAPLDHVSVFRSFAAR